MQWTTLNNGVQMPMLGLGVYKTTGQEEMTNAVRYALDAGYRSFDTAQTYQNERELGVALRQAGIPREEFFLTSKVGTGNMGYQTTLQSFEESLDKLQTDYLDLFLVHWPGQQPERLLDTWHALEELYQKGKLRAIGVSNCGERHLQWIMDDCTVTPAVNQIERTPLLNQQELQATCREWGIVCEAWAPLMRGNLNQPEIVALAEKYGKTPAQIVLRWDVQDGFVVIPKSVNQQRIEENAGIFDFALSEEDMAVLGGMDNGQHTGADPETYDF